MNTFATVPIRADSSKTVGKPRAVPIRIASNRGLLKRIRRLIESSRRILSMLLT